MTTPLPTPEQEARARWDLLLADLEYRQDQMRRTRQEMKFAPWQFAVGGFSAGAAWAAVILAMTKLL
jgi:acetyl esterase/lipase